MNLIYHETSVAPRAPKNILVTVRVPRQQHALLEAVREVRGDETRSDTVRVAITRFLKSYLKDNNEVVQ